MIKVLFTGGGTGGHLYPLIAVAQNLQSIAPDAKIEFIGSKNKIEEKAVPASGFVFHGISVVPFPRKIGFELITFPFVFAKSLISSIRIVKRFRPSVAVGSGAYISAPGIIAAKIKGAKIILLEQNSFPGVTTKLLQGLAEEIHISFRDSIKYFRHKAKVFLTGNPVRVGMKGADKTTARIKFNLDQNKPVLLVLGGSLGAEKINETVAGLISGLKDNGIQIIWQTGKRYFEKYANLSDESVKVMPFIDDMTSAYSASDLLIARAGATTIAEIAATGMAAILIPSPNVANNHQHYNALSLAENDAAVLLEEKLIDENLLNEIITLIKNPSRLNSLRKNVLKFAAPNAGEVIALRIIELAGRDK